MKMKMRTRIAMEQETVKTLNKPWRKNNLKETGLNAQPSFFLESGLGSIFITKLS